jgi:predicted glycoside hydrolase/deacetylase ChbG (UPF0249 family)
MDRKVFFHADDFGVTLKQAGHICECFQKGCLNSVSVMPNSPVVPEAFQLIGELVNSGRIRCVVHLNFLEGKSAAPAEEIPHLVKENGKLGCTFGSLLKANYSAKRKLYKMELKKEIAAQIAVVVKLQQSNRINVDSHQHFHMIPVVWEALMEVIAENHYELQYIRIPQDPLRPLLTTPQVWKYIRPVNLVKWMVLKVIGPSKKKIAATGADVPVFFGMFFTCMMKLEIVEKLLPGYMRCADERGRDLELMFHPGAVPERKLLLDPDNRELQQFYAARERDEEYMALVSLKNAGL